MRTQLVREWMTPNPICATPEMTLPEAHKIMAEKRIRRLLIVKEGKLMGIVTQGDVRGAQPSEATTLSIFELNYLLSKLTLDRIMTPAPITIRPDETVYDAARLMLQKKIAGLPVVEGDKVVGILTESDIFRMIVRLWEQEAEDALASL